jgi:hypothetical protein
MALKLVVAAFTNNEKFIDKTLGDIDYYLRRNSISHKSHSKKKEQIRNLI